jgi:hypothetical protein
MTATRTNILLLLGISILASSCFTPQQVIRISPAPSENVFWHQGQPIAEDKRDSIIARAAYSHANRDYLIFDLEFFNESSQPCLITPEQLTLRTDGNFQLPAVDPERLLFTAEMDASRREARAKNWAVAGGVALASAAVVAAANSDSADEETAAWDESNYDEVDAAADVAESLSMIAWGVSFQQEPVLSVTADVLPHTDDPIFWRQVALRRTTLMPGAHIRGLVAFARATDAADFTLQVPTECTSFSFRFVQRVFQP